MSRDGVPPRDKEAWRLSGPPRGEEQGQRLRHGELCGGRGPSALQDPEGVGKAFRTCLMGLLTKGDKIIHFRDLASYLAQHRIQETSSFYY